MTYFFKKAFVLFILMILSGCSVFNFFSSNKPKIASLEAFEKKFELVKKWENQIGSNDVLKSGVGSFGPKIFGKKVIATIGSGSVIAFDLEKGSNVWKINLNYKILCSVGFLQLNQTEFIAIISEFGELVLLDSTGQVFWKSKLNGIVRIAPIITNSVVVTLYADNRVVAYDLKSGKRVWALKRGAPPLILHGQSGMTLLSENQTELNQGFKNENQILINMAGGRILMLDSQTGSVNWESRVVFSSGTNEVERIVDLMGSPYVDKDVCTTSYQNSIVCLSFLDGNVTWKRSFRSVQPASFTPSTVVALDPDSKITAFSRGEDRSAIWESEKFFLRELSAPIIWKNIVWTVDKEGFLHGLALKNGEIVSRYRLKDGTLSGMMKTVSNNGLLIQTASGQLILLNHVEENEKY
ncbi:MAG: hypothetical protein CBD16_00750 [Betaproteobacteria bacterium TMED156]|nr:MAG: hypothetical protein CBD16_00750 [Betaproteobacteria bacterium TMED156]